MGEFITTFITTLLLWIVFGGLAVIFIAAVQIAPLPLFGIIILAFILKGVFST